MTAFILNEETARDWVTSLVMAYELTCLDNGINRPTLEPPPQLSLDWRPREPGQEDTTAALIRQAHHQGVFARPEHAGVAIQFVDDGDDWCYHFLLDISAPTPVTLSSEPKAVNLLGDDSTFGVDAAMGILREAAQTADDLLKRLNAFVEAVSGEIG